MKRSVNFSAPRKFALMAAMRNSTGESWLCEPSPETARRLAADIETLKAAGKYQIAIDLEVCASQVTKSEHKNLGDVMYAGYDDGWRVGRDGFIAPDGTTRKTPSLTWYYAMAAIERAAALRSNNG